LESPKSAKSKTPDGNAAAWVANALRSRRGDRAIVRRTDVRRCVV
jgi:hypothetical protein